MAFTSPLTSILYNLDLLSKKPGYLSFTCLVNMPAAFTASYCGLWANARNIFVASRTHGNNDVGKANKIIHWFEAAMI